MALSVDAVQQALKAPGPAMTKPSVPPKTVPGWQTWPADAPKPAISPFNPAQAKQHQEEWAAYLKVPVESTNSVGAKMVLIPPGEFLMGAPDTDTDASPQEKPQHRVTLTKPFFLGTTEVTNRQFRQFVEATKYVTQAESDGQGAFDINPKARRASNTWNSPELQKKGGDEHAVRCVSWEDARRYCEWLTKTEGHTYRLPTEAEWEYACRAGTTTRYSFGNDLSVTPSPPGTGGAPLRAVAQLPANPFGLFDMHGGVNEMCLDSGRTFTAEPVTDPLGSLDVNMPAVVRGGAVSSHAARLRSSHRYINDARQFPETNFATTMLGFRVVREFNTPPPLAKAPFNADEARQHQEAWAKYLNVPVEYTNSIGIKFRLIPPGEFLMGSTPAEIEEATRAAGGDENWKLHLKSEVPQHKVILTNPYYLGVHEVTQQAYEQVTGNNPAFFSARGEGKDRVDMRETGTLPVEQVSWTEALAFTKQLGEKEPSLKDGYALPTEAEWEFACRAGSLTKYCFGEDPASLSGYGWLYASLTHPVGQLKPNAFQLYDMHGNVWEWVHDHWESNYYEQIAPTPAINPRGPDSPNDRRTTRGGSWINPESCLRSAHRISESENRRGSILGFRLLLSVDAVRHSLKEAGPERP